MIDIDKLEQQARDALEIVRRAKCPYYDTGCRPYRAARAVPDLAQAVLDLAGELREARRRADVAEKVAIKQARALTLACEVANGEREYTERPKGFLTAYWFLDVAEAEPSESGEEVQDGND